jgi:hypothetical protein
VTIHRSSNHTWSSIGSHVIHHNRKPLEKGIDRLAGEMSKVLLLSPISRVHPSLNLSIPSMSIFQLLPNPKWKVLYLNPIEFGLTQSMKQVVDRLVVGIEHIPRSWRKEVNQNQHPPKPTRERSEKTNSSSYWTTPVRPVDSTGQTVPCWSALTEPENFHRRILH